MKKIFLAEVKRNFEILFYVIFRVLCLREYGDSRAQGPNRQ
jgi:hypothetical protein